MGTGIEKFDVKGFGATVAYTVDGESLGEISEETWSARSATVVFKGKSTHPGKAKGIMVNAVYALADYVSRFPKDLLPKLRKSVSVSCIPMPASWTSRESSLKILLRDFELSGLDAKEKVLRDMVAQTQARFPEVKISIEVKESWEYERGVERSSGVNPNVMEAARRADWNRLGNQPAADRRIEMTFMGLPTPNIFTGGRIFMGSWNLIRVAVWNDRNLDQSRANLRREGAEIVALASGESSRTGSGPCI